MSVALAQMGHRVVALRPGLKAPAGEHLLDATLDGQRMSPAQVHDLIHQFPGLNWGVMLEGICVLDFDGDDAWVSPLVNAPWKGEKRSQRSPWKANQPHKGTLIPSRPVPLTPTVQTERGYQLWFRVPRGVTLRNVKLDNNLELKAKGYVPLPGNIHPSGVVYSWLPGLSVLDLPLAEVPRWALDLFEQRTKRESKRGKRQAQSVAKDQQATHSRSIPADILAKLNDDETARRLLARHGIKYREGAGFRCILPGHDEKRSSANIWRTPEGTLVYRDFHERDGRGSYRLADVYAATVTGKVSVLRRGEQVAWAIRMLADLKLLDLQKLGVSHPSPSEITEGILKVWRGIILLARCRLAYSQADAEPFPLGWSFVAHWSGVSEPTAGKAIKELLRLKFLQPVRRRQTKLFLFKLGPAAQPIPRFIAAACPRSKPWPGVLFGVRVRRRL